MRSELSRIFVEAFVARFSESENKVLQGEAQRLEQALKLHEGNTHDPENGVHTDIGWVPEECSLIFNKAHFEAEE